MTSELTRKLMTTAEASEWLTAAGVPRTVATLEALRCRGGKGCPPFRNFGRAVRYATDDLEAWIEASLTGPQQPEIKTKRRRGWS